MIRIYRDPRKHWQQRAAALFATGLTQHGLDFRFCDATKATWNASERIREGDLTVFWGHNNAGLIGACRAAGAPYLVMETGYWPDRLLTRTQTKWTSLGYGGLNGHAMFTIHDAPADRFEQCGHELSQWNHAGEGFLIVGQVKGDASIARIDIVKWYREAHDALTVLTDEPIWFRPHPIAIEANCGIQILPGSLPQAIARVRCIITFNSNTAVEAVLAGTPAIAVDPGSMAYPVTAHAVADALDPEMPDREQWGYNLAYSQWLDDEIASGLAWEHLETLYVHANRNATDHRTDRTG